MTGLRVSDFDFNLPAELIAQQPPAERGQSRMLVVSFAPQSRRPAGSERHPRHSRAPFRAPSENAGWPRSRF
jgi:hypothetical protein